MNILNILVKAIMINENSNDKENNIDKNIIIESKSYTKKELENIVSMIIKQNIHLKFLWHKNNLKNNKIDLHLTKIKIILYLLREEKFLMKCIF